MIESYEPLQTSPVTLDEVKAFLKIETTEDDTLLTELIESYTRQVEEISGRTLRPVQVVFRLPKIEESYIRAPYEPIASLINVENEDGITLTVVNASLFYTEGFTDKPVTITYQTGASTNAMLKELVKRIVAFAYEHRGEVIEFPDEIRQMMKFVRKVRL
jgi:hypothetical protein